MDDNKLSIDKENNRRSVYSIVSFILSVVPMAVLLIVFILCLIVSGGKSGDNDAGAVWWVFIVMIWIFVPVAPIISIPSVIFGVMGLKGKKKAYARLGIIFASLNILIVLFIYGWPLL